MNMLKMQQEMFSYFMDINLGLLKNQHIFLEENARQNIWTLILYPAARFNDKVVAERRAASKAMHCGSRSPE